MYTQIFLSNNLKRIVFLSLVLISFPAVSNELVKDPLGSVQWNDMYSAFLKEHKAVFDDRVIVKAPDYAEDPMNVPVSVDATAIGDVDEIIIFADFNPIPLIAKYHIEEAKPVISFRFRIQQASPVRAAVLSDGVWYVGGVWVNSAGGGCTVASVERLAGDWPDYLGDVYGKVWENNDISRLRFLINHPMDTGLVDGIPAFYIEYLDFYDDKGTELATLELYEPINENPVLSLDFNTTNSILMSGSDNNGNAFEAEFLQ